MHIKNQKKLTYRVGATALFTSMIFLAEGVHGCDRVQQILTNHYEGLMKKREEAYTEEKQILEQELNLQQEQKKLTEVELKAVVGGVGDTPIIEEINRLRLSVDKDAGTLGDALGSLTENLNDIPGLTVVSKVVGLKETLEAVKETLVAVQDEKEKLVQTQLKLKRATGASGGNTPILSRIQRINKNNGQLIEEKKTAEEEVMQLKKALAASEREKEELKRKSMEAESQLAAVRVETGGGGDTPLPERLQKFRKALEAEVVIVKQEVEDARGAASALAGETSMLEEELLSKEKLVEDMTTIIASKDEALSELFIKYKRAKHEAKTLDAELSIVQVARSETKEQLNRVVGIQFNGAAPFNDLNTPIHKVEESSTK